MQPLELPVPSAVLPSNVLDSCATDGQFERDEPHSEAFCDLLVAVCGLALVVTGLVVAGPRLVGGPVPTLRFWTILGPLLMLPVVILIGLLLRQVASRVAEQPAGGCGSRWVPADWAFSS